MTVTPVAFATFDVSKLAAWRRSLHLSQKEVAAVADIRSDDLSRLERFVESGGHLHRVIDALATLSSDSTTTETAHQ